MKLADYKRKVYKLMDSEGLPRADAGYFGNLTKRSTWETIEGFCEYNAKLDTEAKYTPDEYMRLVVNYSENLGVSASVPQSFQDKPEPEVQTITIVSASFDKQPTQELEQPIIEPAQTQDGAVPCPEVCKTQDYGLDDLLAEIAPQTAPAQTQITELPDSSFVPQEWSNDNDKLPRIITMDEFNALLNTVPAPIEQTDTTQAKTVLQNSKKWYERPAILVGLFAALLCGSFLFTVGYRATNGGSMAPVVQVTTEK